MSFSVAITAISVDVYPGGCFPWWLCHKELPLFSLLVELFDHVFAFLFIAFKPLPQEIGKQKEPEDGKENEEFNEDDEPKGFAHGHAAESLIIEAEYSDQEIHGFSAFKSK